MTFWTSPYKFIILLICNHKYANDQLFGIGGIQQQKKQKKPLGTVPKFNRNSGHINTSNTPFICSGFTSMKMARINKRYRKPKGQ
jgi:hypothetical protein